MDFLEQIQNLKDQFRSTTRFDLPNNFRNVVISGMGGSGIAGRIFQEIYTGKPVFVNETYDIPSWVDSSTLFIGISYSGNTEETLTSIESARKAGATVIGISSGGKLTDLSIRNVSVPRGFQPRAALGYLLAPLLNSFDVINDKGRESVFRMLEDLDREHEELKSVASEIVNEEKIPVLLTLPGFRSVGIRWKTQFNENAKLLSFSLNFPELDHNDIMAFEKTYLRDRFYPILIGDTENVHIKKRIAVTSDLTGFKFRSLQLKGKNLLEKAIYSVHCGDYVSYHASRIRGVDPEDVGVIEKLKTELAK